MPYFLESLSATNLENRDPSLTLQVTVTNKFITASNDNRFIVNFWSLQTFTSCFFLCFCLGCDINSQVEQQAIEQPRVVELATPTQPQDRPEAPKLLPLKPVSLDDKKSNLSHDSMSQFEGISQGTQQKKAPVATPVDPLKQVKTFIDRQEWTQAIDVLQSVMINSPEQSEALKLLAVCYCQLGEFRKASPYIDKSLKLYPEDSELYYLRGIAFYNTGKNDAALESLVRAQTLGFNNNSLDLQICTILLNSKNYDEAEQRALKMLNRENSPPNRHAELILAFVAIQKKDMNTARKYYELCQEQGECPPAMMQSLGQMLEGN